MILSTRCDFKKYSSLKIQSPCVCVCVCGYVYIHIRRHSKETLKIAAAITTQPLLSCNSSRGSFMKTTAEASVHPTDKDSKQAMNLF